MLTESEVQSRFRQLVRGGILEVETIGKIEELLEELRPESPLRHRLERELQEIRQLQEVRS